MNCPNCGKPMQQFYRDKSYSRRAANPHKIYDRAFYECPTDDLWIQEEKPQVVKEQPEVVA